MDDDLIERISHASVLVAYPKADHWLTMPEGTKNQHRARSKLRLEMMRKCGLDIRIKPVKVKK